MVSGGTSVWRYPAVYYNRCLGSILCPSPHPSIPYVCHGRQVSLPVHPYVHHGPQVPLSPVHPYVHHRSQVSLFPSPSLCLSRAPGVSSSSPSLRPPRAPGVVDSGTTEWGVSRRPDSETSIGPVGRRTRVSYGRGGSKVPSPNPRPRLRLIPL